MFCLSMLVHFHPCSIDMPHDRKVRIPIISPSTTSRLSRVCQEHDHHRLRDRALPAARRVNVCSRCGRFHSHGGTPRMDGLWGKIVVSMDDLDWFGGYHHFRKPSYYHFLISSHFSCLGLLMLLYDTELNVHQGIQGDLTGCNWHRPGPVMRFNVCFLGDQEVQRYAQVLASFTERSKGILQQHPGFRNHGWLARYPK